MSSGAGTGTSAAAYRARVNSICSRDNARVRALARSTNNSVAGLERLAVIERNAVNEVKSIQPPSEIAPQVQAWTRTLSAEERVADRLIVLLRTRDRAGIRSIAPQAQQLSTTSRQQARALGLPQCAVSAEPSG